MQNTGATSATTCPRRYVGDIMDDPGDGAGIEHDSFVFVGPDPGSKGRAAAEAGDTIAGTVRAHGLKHTTNPTAPTSMCCVLHIIGLSCGGVYAWGGRLSMELRREREREKRGGGR